MQIMHKVRRPRVPRKARATGTTIAGDMGDKPKPVNATNCAEHCPPGWYTRIMVKERLGANEKQMKRWIALGFLPSEKLNNGGWALYSEESVQRVLNRIQDGSIDIMDTLDDEYESDSQFCAGEVTRVFGMLEEGISLVQIQIRTQIHPFALRAIKKEYDHFTDSITVPNTILDQMNRVTLPGNFPLRNATDILEVMKSAAEERMCPECRVQPCADQCTACLKRRLAPMPTPTAAMPPAPPPAPPPAKSSDTRIQSDTSEAGAATAAA